jgi:hypothetical protein
MAEIVKAKEPSLARKLRICGNSGYLRDEDTKEGEL